MMHLQDIYLNFCLKEKRRSDFCHFLFSAFLLTQAHRIFIFTFTRVFFLFSVTTTTPFLTKYYICRFQYYTHNIVSAYVMLSKTESRASNNRFINTFSTLSHTNLRKRFLLTWRGRRSCFTVRQACLSTGGFIEGVTVFSLRNVITTEQGGWHLSNA